MDLFVGVTDGDSYELLANQPGLDEVNFCQPGDSIHLSYLQNESGSKSWQSQ